MHRFFHHRCYISGHWTYNGMQVVWLENDRIKVGVLVGRGADIFEFRYKPKDVNFLLRLPGTIKNPQTIFAQRRDTHTQMEDYYYGGWQDCLPNSAPLEYRGAAYGQHGEVWGIPWEYSIVEDSPEKVAVKCWTRPIRTPLLVEKTISIQTSDPSIHVHARLTNEGSSPFDFIWGQHIAFGLPFLKEGAKIETNARRMVAEPNMPEKRRFKPGVETAWPNALNTSGETIDASIIPPAGQGSFSDLAYLSDFGEKGSYKLTDPQGSFGVGLEWDASLFKHLWFWQERHGIQGAPWWGKVFAVGLEPWTAKWTGNPLAGIENGEWEQLQPQASLETEIKASAIDKMFKP